jgi:hypothetical protein
MRTTRAAAPALLACAALLASGCITRHVRQDVFESGTGKIQVFLRTDKRLLSVVAKGYSHPVTISTVRIAHILSRLDVRDSVEDGNRRKPAIPTELLYDVADGMSRALERAGENQEVVVMAVRTERTFKVFDQDYLTSLVAYVRGDQLYIHMSRVDWFVPDNKRGQGLPQPRVGDHPTKMKLYPGTAMTLVDTQSAAIDWRDPIFSRPTRTKILPTGEVKRKTILLESADGEQVGEEIEALPELPPGLTPAQLRALADLEEERQAGRISESEFRNRQREILDQ